MTSRKPASNDGAGNPVAKTSVPVRFNNDTAADPEREAWLEEHKATITGEDGAWVLEYGSGTLLDAETYSDALFEACNIVKD